MFASKKRRWVNIPPSFFVPFVSKSEILIRGNKNPRTFVRGFVVGEGGFGPPKSLTTDLQSAPFGRSGTLPHYGAGDRSRTNNLLITNQLLCH